ncbi:MAG: pyridoxamine 5'-phosphate oxidase [Rhodospirillaceae bacterium]|nr:pyridoxamine 5'-phosphate oxidase [Rhodospirillaceae bacterium]OUX29914.1 MAG: pyridoxamine 5'-phosphate oxidase [Rhodospirillaceae bacterium TMED256]
MPTEYKKSPVSHFNEWFEDAKQSESVLPEAMSVASVGPDGRPSTRMVLLKQVDEAGFVFYTNLQSRKGDEISTNAHVALLFHWKSLKRQIRIEGLSEPVTDAEADAYFASRDRGAQIGAWASDQSRVMTGRFDLEKRVAQFTAKFGVSKIERPPFWSGFRVVPNRLEFWSDGHFRLHERLIYLKDGEDWRTERLFP